MAFAMNRKLVEREWIVPKLTEYAKLAKRLDPKNDALEYATVLYGGLCLRHRGRSGGDFVYTNLSAMGEFLITMRVLYSDQYVNAKVKRDAAIIKSALKDLSDARDARLFPLGNNRVRSGLIDLKDSDKKWLQRTRVPGIFEHHKTATLKLLDEVEKAVTEQSSVLAALF
jgi:hypothetical protein